MTEAKARDLITASAFTTAAIYLYRKLVEPAVGTSQSGLGPTSSEQEPHPITIGNTTIERQPTTIGGQAAQLLGAGPVAPVSRFVVGWGFTYIVLALVAEGEADLAGTFAVLVATGAILGNGVQVSRDINTQLHRAEKEKRSPTALEAEASPTTSISWGGGSTPPPLSATMPGGERANPTPRNKTQRPRHRSARFHARSI